MPTPPRDLGRFESLLQIVKDLRGPEGCPWDKEQTHESLTRYAIEEAFELAEAIDSGSTKDTQEELGDLLFQVVLHAELARQAGQFDVKDVIETLNEKMVRRHPHVFADKKVSGTNEVLLNWAAIKAKEKAKNKALHLDVPVNMASLMRAQKIGEKTEKLKFDWQKWQEVWAKVREEMDELQAELEKQNRSVDNIEAELGDVLFSLAQLARHLKLDAEGSLRRANSRFSQRFEKMQELVRQKGSQWESLDNDEKEKFWQQAKKEINSSPR